MFLTNDSENIPNASDGSVNYRHKPTREEEEVGYMKSITKKQKLYGNAIRQEQPYELGDLVGLQVDHVGHTNTTSKVLPCKVTSVHSSSNGSMIYKVCTLQGMLSTLYGAQDLLDLREGDFADLRCLDPTNLPTITFAEACKEHVSKGINPPAEGCSCNGKCVTRVRVRVRV